MARIRSQQLIHLYSTTPRVRLHGISRPMLEFCFSKLEISKDLVNFSLRQHNFDMTR